MGGALPQYSDFTPAGDRVFYLAREPDASVLVLMVREPEGASRVLFDPDTVPGEAHHAIAWYVPSPDGRHIACAVFPSGSEESTIQVLTSTPVPPWRRPRPRRALPSCTGWAPTRRGMRWCWRAGSTPMSS
ncbi:hypothetical protein [Nonomuraea sp. GTA35]|uniref:hypothetical protein n=1 Tax=Nonomuraea sp. GTA35 TaxID=1676746 RepID=UPI0035BFD6E6